MPRPNIQRGFTQGERATSMFFISRGTVGVFVVPDSDDPTDGPGEESYVISLGAGSFFGEVSLLEEVLPHTHPAKFRSHLLSVRSPVEYQHSPRRARRDRRLMRPAKNALLSFYRFQVHMRTANVRAETFTELQVMHAEDFQALAEVFPEFKVRSSTRYHHYFAT